MMMSRLTVHDLIVSPRLWAEPADHHRVIDPEASLLLLPAATFASPRC